MNKIVLAYITCESVKQAEFIGETLLKKRLAGCINIYPQMKSMFFWPPVSGKINENKEVVLIAKTIEEKYAQLEAEVIEIHSFDTPCIMAIPTAYVSKKYYDWLITEIEAPIII